MYSVFVHKRPIRFAFLINPHEDQWLEQLDAICEYTLDKWRGRFNPVVPTNGETLESEWWDFLKKIDPDYAISTAGDSKFKHTSKSVTNPISSTAVTGACEFSTGVDVRR